MHHYIIYKITNTVSGRIYIGSHKTENINDDYMGSGKYLKHAQDKHGLSIFTKEILFVYDNPDEMYAKGAEIVDENFLAEENTYNLRIGGKGGWDYVASIGKTFANIELAREGRRKVDDILEERYGENWRTELAKLANETANSPESLSKSKNKKWHLR